jgi:hypothetical protein
LHIFQSKNPKLFELIIVFKQESASNERYLVRTKILYAKNESFLYQRPVLIAEVEVQVVSYVHMSLGRLVSEKCTYHISHFSCEESRSQGTKINVSQLHLSLGQARFETEILSHKPKAAGELCSVDLYGPLATGRRGVHYIFIYLDVITMFVKLCFEGSYCQDVTTENYQALCNRRGRQKCILSDNGPQFTSLLWKKQLAD